LNSGKEEKESSNSRGVMGYRGANGETTIENKRWIRKNKVMFTTMYDFFLGSGRNFLARGGGLMVWGGEMNWVRGDGGELS